MPPLRSCSQNEKPPCVPRPGIDGGMDRERRRLGDLRPQLRVQLVDDRARVEARLRRARPRA